MNNKTINDTKTKKPNKKLKIIILSILLLLVITAVAVVVYTIAFHEPDNQIDETKPFDVIDSPDGNNSSVGSGKNEFNFLFLGKDRTGANTDVMMIINYNVKDGDISVLQIPRDTYVELDNRSYKINSLYSKYLSEAKKNKESSPENYSLSKVAKTLEKNLCINIHYYSMINLDGFRNIVDILGGIEVDIPQDMYCHDDTKDEYFTLKKGKHLLDGQQAELFVRFRSGYIQADIGRMNAQKIFMSALIKTVKENFTISKIVKMTSEIYKNLTTDLPLDDMIYFAKNMFSIDMEKINFMSMPGEAVYSGLSYYVMNRKATMNIIQNYFNIYSDVVIDDTIFDPNRVFSSKYNSAISERYNKEPSQNQGNSQSAEDINDSSIHIPRK